jgi:SAM-dependent methyltransferase
LEAHEYRTLFEFESHYWWFKALHAVIVDTLTGLGVKSGHIILDAGCGTGQNLVNIKNAVTPLGFGFDVAAEAAPFWKLRGLSGLVRASINDIPFCSEHFDAVVSIDVLECEEVDEDAACLEMWRVLKPGGKLLLVVPAYEWMMSPEHHKAVGASRRYSKARLRRIFSGIPLREIRITHLFATLFPAIASYRLALRWFDSGTEGVPQSELRPLNPFINTTFFRITDMERRVLRWTDLPFGSSILAVYEKEK